MNNRLWNIKNPYQGPQKRVLCVCSAGLLRSPTAAWVLSNPPFDFNTRAAGIDTDHALIPVDDALIMWADEIVCMTTEHSEELLARFKTYERPVLVLGVPDCYARRDPKLVEMIAQRYPEELELHRKQKAAEDA